MAGTIVMFDLDGTLADTMPQLVDALVEAFREHLNDDDGRPPREQIIDLLHMSPPQMLQGFAEMSGLPASRIQSEFRLIVDSLPTRLFADVPAVLDALKKAGWLIVVSSTTPDVAMRGRLEAVGVAEWCDLALGTNLDEGVTKEDHPRVASERLGISAAEFAAASVFAGDMPDDMRLARKAGMLAVGRVTDSNGELLSGAGAQHVIGDLAQLLALLQVPLR